MSWSINYIGTPDNVLEALDKVVEVQRLQGASKKEYEEALPAIKALVEQNRDANKKAISLIANGHKTITAEGETLWSQLNIELKPLPGYLV